MKDKNLKIQCDNASSLVQSYLDGELTEAQAAPLREHLLDCPGCREQAKEGRTLRRWFQDTGVHAATNDGASLAPEGFASRVARRAFAGDPGLLIPEPRRLNLMPFLLVATAVAATLLLVFSIVLQRQTIPDSGVLSADDYQPPWEDRAADEGWVIDEGTQPAYSVPAPVPVAAEADEDGEPKIAEEGDGEAPANAERPTLYTEDD